MEDCTHCHIPYQIDYFGKSGGTLEDKSVRLWLTDSVKRFGSKWRLDMSLLGRYTTLLFNSRDAAMRIVFVTNTCYYCLQS